jgi:hypothetical protein
MLRRELGDKTFTAGLQDFYQKNKFSFASFNDIQKSFERVSKENLGSEFNQWVRRKGAPKIELVSSKAEKEGDGFSLSLVIEQSQTEDAYLLQIPVAVTMEGEARAWQTVVKMDKNILISIFICLPGLRVDIDPSLTSFADSTLVRHRLPYLRRWGPKRCLWFFPLMRRLLCSGSTGSFPFFLRRLALKRLR